MFTVFTFHVLKQGHCSKNNNTTATTTPHQIEFTTNAKYHITKLMQNKDLQEPIKQLMSHISNKQRKEYHNAYCSAAKKQPLWFNQKKNYNLSKIPDVQIN